MTHQPGEASYKAISPPRTALELLCNVGCRPQRGQDIRKYILDSLIHRPFIATQHHADHALIGGLPGLVRKIERLDPRASYALQVRYCVRTYLEASDRMSSAKFQSAAKSSAGVALQAHRGTGTNASLEDLAPNSRAFSAPASRCCKEFRTESCRPAWHALPHPCLGRPRSRVE